MWIELKKEWMGFPKGTVLTVQEELANRLEIQKVAAPTKSPESVPTRTIYFPPGKKEDPGQVSMTDDINNMTRQELNEFMEEQGVDVPTQVLLNPNETDKTKHEYQPKILSILRSDIAEKAVKMGLRYEVAGEEVVDKTVNLVPREPNRGEDKMMKSSPVEK